MSQLGDQIVAVGRELAAHTRTCFQCRTFALTMGRCFIGLSIVNRGSLLLTRLQAERAR